MDFVKVITVQELRWQASDESRRCCATLRRRDLKPMPSLFERGGRVLRAREAISTLNEYCPPLGARDGLRLDFNENTAGCSPRVLECLRKLDGETLACYPQREQGERILAEYLDITRDELLLTNGTDEAIHLVCQTYLQPGDEALIVVPTFAMFEIYAAATGASDFDSTAPDSNFTESVLAHISEDAIHCGRELNNPTGPSCRHGTHSNRESGPRSGNSG